MKSEKGGGSGVRTGLCAWGGCGRVWEEWKSMDEYGGWG